MIKFDKTEVYGMGAALRGMRNPRKSWDKGDSGEQCMNEYDVMFGFEPNCEFIVGENDLALAKKLVQAGADHRKFLRQIFVSVDIIAPRYWWMEFDTYKVGTVANSESTMHTITKREFELEDFSWDENPGRKKSDPEVKVVQWLNLYREQYNAYKMAGMDELAQGAWRAIIQLLPQSYNQMRTCTMNYEVLLNQYHARKDHKLSEWHEYCDWVETLPYFREMCLEK